MSVPLTLRVFVSWDRHSRSMEVVVGASGKGWDGTARKTLRRGDIDVAVNEKGGPVFIRLCRAEALDNTFRAVGNKLKRHEGPTAKQLQHILTRCGELMEEIVERRTVEQKFD